MHKKIKLGIVGYGNLGKGVEMAISQNKDMELVAVFSRRPAAQVLSAAPVYNMNQLKDFQSKIDVMILCGGSAKDLPQQTPEIAKYFNTVDSFDTHANIPEYFKTVDLQAKKNQHLSLISTGWDPGLFSMLRLLGESVLPEGKTYTFWGKGLSQGHSDALRKVEGVKLAAQYTIPDKNAIQEVYQGKQPDFPAEKMHNRICYVVLEENTDAAKVEKDIITMPDYFAPYHTEVHFISEEEFKKNHQAMPHGGNVIRAGNSAKNNKQIFEFSLNLASNPEFTSSVLVAFSRAVFRLSKNGKSGAISVFDIPLGMLSPKSPADLRKELL